MATEELLTSQHIMAMLTEWLANLKSAVDKDDGGKEACEATRMLLGIASILHAYFPEMLNVDMVDQLRDAFQEASEYVSGEIGRNNGPDGCYDLYRDNINSRCEDLSRLFPPP